MSKARVLRLEILAGDTTCAVRPGVFCQYVRTRNFGTLFECRLFTESLDTTKPDGRGWLLRLAACKKAESEE